MVAVHIISDDRERNRVFKTLVRSSALKRLIGRQDLWFSFAVSWGFCHGLDNDISMCTSFVMHIESLGKWNKELAAYACQALWVCCHRCRLKHQCFRLHKDTTPPQPNYNVTPTHIEPEQNNTWKSSTNKSQTPEDGCINIRNMLSIK
jgi:hypothetical protein